MTKDNLVAYLYLMEQIFPQGFDSDAVLREKHRLEAYFTKHFSKGEGKSFRKTIDRNLKYVEEIRRGEVPKKYSPKPDSLKVFIGFHLKLTENVISLDEFEEENKVKFKEYLKENSSVNKVLEQLYLKYPEKLTGIENRISKIENFIKSNDGFMDKLLSKNKDLRSLNETYGDQKLALDFLNFLQKELLETRRQYNRAKLAYQNLGSFGLFFIPIKYALSDEQVILKEFFNEELALDDDILDDLL